MFKILMKNCKSKLVNRFLERDDLSVCSELTETVNLIFKGFFFSLNFSMDRISKIEFVTSYYGLLAFF